MSIALAKLNFQTGIPEWNLDDEPGKAWGTHGPYRKGGPSPYYGPKTCFHTDKH